MDARGAEQGRLSGRAELQRRRYTASGRVTALALDPGCSQSKCTVWVGAAGGGIWRTDNALSGSGASWTFLSDSFGTNAIGALTYAGGVLYAGTGEPNASGDSEAGVGLYKSTDGGSTWPRFRRSSGPITTSAPDRRRTEQRDVHRQRVPRAVDQLGRGRSDKPEPPVHRLDTRGSRCQLRDRWGGDQPADPEASVRPLRVDGRRRDLQLHLGRQRRADLQRDEPKASIRGVNDVELDPGCNGTTNRIVYAATFASTAAGSGGVWRSTDGGATWAQIKSALNPTNNTDRAEFAATALPNGNTRMYAGVGAQGDQFTGNPPVQVGFAAKVYRTDDARAASPSFVDLTTTQNRDYCTAQCWYDNVVYSPPGKPDVVYLGGSYWYGSVPVRRRTAARSSARTTRVLRSRT